MRLNTANRSFFTLVAIALVPYLLLGLFGCGLLSVAAYRIATDGLSGLDSGDQDLRPAVLFFAVVAAGTVIAALSVRRQVQATRALTTHVAGRSLPVPAAVEHAAERARLHGRIDVLDDPQLFSFTYGLFSPRVVVSRGLVDAVAADELEAVFHHERYHVRNWDTLKVVVARAASSAFFFLPALRPLQQRYLAGRELAADRHAVREVGERPLTGALFKALGGSTWTELGAAAALGGSEFLDYRVDQLEQGEEPAMPPVPRPSVWLTVAGLGLLVFAIAVTVANAGGDFMAMDRSERPSGGLGTALTVVGVIACMGWWVVLAVVALRRGIRHRLSG